ncbi:MAG TPA: beta-ketoacyl-[acyl-carrier-protein] synthase family protein [Thermoanaerobaculia bacterium]|nr:beta-ketoacyl-[acyl-carrier-protein] synthase family protein [Thermoanaerobaculia bacterium]
MRRVAVTGIGILSALGRGVDAHLEAVRRASSGVRRIRRFDPEPYVCRIAAEVSEEAIPDLPRDVDRVTAYALLAAEEAIEQAGLVLDAAAAGRTATVIGTALGGSETLDSGYERLYGRGQTRLPPMSIPRGMYNAPTSEVSRRWRLTGPAFATVSACASGAHAIGQAAMWIRFGLADAAVAGGADAPLTPGIVRGWEALRVLAPEGDDPARACRPFSEDRQGMVLGEGAAVLVLEEMERARGRGAAILGEIVGFGMTSDAAHPTDPSVEGEARAISRALEDAALDAEAIGYINAHGTATRANDVAEAEAIRRALGEAGERIPVSSTKSMHGHAMGAGGAIEAALSLASLDSGWLPPTLNLERPDPACRLAHVALLPRPARVTAFLSNSFAFGGLNAVLAIRTIHASS